MITKPLHAVHSVILILSRLRTEATNNTLATVVFSFQVKPGGISQRTSTIVSYKRPHTRYEERGHHTVLLIAKPLGHPEGVVHCVARSTRYVLPKALSLSRGRRSAERRTHRSEPSHHALSAVSLVFANTAEQESLAWYQGDLQAAITAEDWPKVNIPVVKHAGGNKVGKCRGR